MSPRPRACASLLAGLLGVAGAAQADGLTPAADRLWTSNRIDVPDTSDLQARLDALSLRLRPPEAHAAAPAGAPVPGRPAAPRLLEPNAGAKAMVGEMLLRWLPPAEAVAGSESFVVEVARDAAFARVVWRGADLRVPRTRFEPTASAFGSPEGAYFWRVAGVRADGERGPWSAAASFELRSMPRAPMAALSPDGLRIELGWDQPPEHRVEAQLARDPAFREVAAEASFASDRGTLRRPATGTWYARYRTIDSDGFATPWSPPSRIEVAADWRKSVEALMARSFAR